MNSASGCRRADRSRPQSGRWQDASGQEITSCASVCGSAEEKIMVTAQKVYSMLGNESLWSVAERCHTLLSAAEIPYSICSGVAVCLHGYQRNTVDLDLVIRSHDRAAVRGILSDGGLAWNETNAEFRTPEGIAVQFLIAGQKAGKGSEVTIPEPIGEVNVEQREGLPVVRLSRLIEMKIACGMSELAPDPQRLCGRRRIDRRPKSRRFLRPLHSHVAASHVSRVDSQCQRGRMNRDMESLVVQFQKRLVEMAAALDGLSG